MSFDEIKQLKTIIENFIKNSLKNEPDQKVKDYYNIKYKWFTTKASFWLWTEADIPWLAFLKDWNEVSKVIYPCLLLNRKTKTLVVSYWISETNESDLDWWNIWKKKIGEELNWKKYKDSFIQRVYEIKDDGKLPIEEIIKDIDVVINRYLFNDIQLILNTKKQIILYWPPWTWKTYSVKGIIESHSWEDFKDLKEQWRVEFITFHQSFSYEEFIEWIKPDLDWDSEEISYKIEDWILKKISDRAKQKDKNNFDEKIEELKEKLIENSIEINENTKFTLKYRWWKTFKISPKNTKNPDFYYPVNINKIKDLYLNNLKRNNVYNSSYAIWILEYLYKNWLKKYNENYIWEPKNYYLVIDEINRWNISKIFWELITLLEADKRLWEENEVITKLPYSKENFWIPSNLFIVATMNTSDKSIVSLDTALRRRFWFVEMLPDYDLPELDKNIEWINLAELLQKINDRIEYLIDKDHLIGHSYFLKINNLEDLKLAIYNEIYPLLEEYFYWEEEKIRLVLWSKLFKKKNIYKNLFEDKNDFENDEIQYKINENLKNDEFIMALKNIIKSNEEN